MKGPLRASRLKSVLCQNGNHVGDEIGCDGFVMYVGETTRRACPCACHAVTGEGDS